MSISFDSPDPGWAQKIANAVAENFKDLNLERRYGASAYSRKFLEEKLEELKIKLEESEKALVAYQDKEQIITSQGQGPAAAGRFRSPFSECCASAGSDRAHSRARAMGASVKDEGPGLAAGPE